MANAKTNFYNKQVAQSDFAFVLRLKRIRKAAAFLW